MFLDIPELRVFYKNVKLGQTDNWNVVSDFWKKWLYLDLDCFEKHKAKMSQKQPIVYIILRILRSKLAILVNIWDHSLTVRFLQPIIVVLTTRLSEVRNLPYILSKLFKHFYTQKLGV